MAEILPKKRKKKTKKRTIAVKRGKNANFEKCFHYFSSWSNILSFLATRTSIGKTQVNKWRCMNLLFLFPQKWHKKSEKFQFLRHFSGVFLHTNSKMMCLLTISSGIKHQSCLKFGIKVKIGPIWKKMKIFFQNSHFYPFLRQFFDFLVVFSVFW